MNRLRRIKDKDERNRREREYRRGKDPDWWKGKETECKVKRSCIYGGNTTCDYLVIEGESRYLTGHPIKDGKCDLYQKGPRKRSETPKLPEAPVLKVNKLREV